MFKKNEFTMNIGLPSIMLIFIVLCLVSFGILSLVSSSSDKKLSLKVLTRSTAYYNACNQAEETLCNIDRQLHEAYKNAISENEYYDSISNIPTIYTYEISDLQYLMIELDYKYPADTTAQPYTIKTWRVMTQDNLEYDTGLDLIEIY